MSPELASQAASELSTAGPAVFLQALPQGFPSWILVVTVLPFALVLLTSFARLSIILAFLRHGLGLPEVPSATVSTGLAVLLSLVTMAPVIERVQREALVPLARDELSGEQAVARAWGPLEGFMRHQTRVTDRTLFQGLLRERGVTCEESDHRVVLPAFVLSELKSGFQIGLVIWVPFLVVDLLVAMLLSVAAVSLEPRRVALPLKLLLFVTVDGWSLLAQGLVRSFAGGA